MQLLASTRIQVEQYAMLLDWKGAATRCRILGVRSVCCLRLDRRASWADVRTRGRKAMRETGPVWATAITCFQQGASALNLRPCLRRIASGGEAGSLCPDTARWPVRHNALLPLRPYVHELHDVLGGLRRVRQNHRCASDAANEPHFVVVQLFLNTDVG